MSGTRLPQLNRYIHRLPPTPLIPVQLEPDLPAIWCKLEYMNPSGSTKDRIARYILEKALRLGKINTNSLVIEASNGSTGMAMALACAQLGLRFLVVMPEGLKSKHWLTIRAYGGDVRFIRQEEGMMGAIAESERLAVELNAFLPRQYKNPDCAETHRHWTAREIVDQMPAGNIDAVVSGVGTGGTLIGLYQGLSDAGCEVVPIAARPVSIADALDVDYHNHSRRIPGVSESLSGIFNKDNLPNLLTIEVDDDWAIHTTRKLIKKGFPGRPQFRIEFLRSLGSFPAVGKRERSDCHGFPRSHGALFYHRSVFDLPLEVNLLLYRLQLGKKLINTTPLFLW